MNSVVQKLIHRLSKSELQLLKTLTKPEAQYLANTFSKDIENYVSYTDGISDNEDYNKPIIVFGSNIQLMKVKGFFYYKIVNQPNYRVYSVSQINSFNQNTDEMYSMPFVDCSGLAVLQINKNENLHGNMENWSVSCILEKLTERSRRRGLTLVLTEIDFGYGLKDDTEFKYYDVCNSVLQGYAEGLTVKVEDASNL